MLPRHVREYRHHATRQWVYQFLRRNAFVFVLIAAATFMFAASRYLRFIFDVNRQILRYPTCSQRFEVLGVPYLQDYGSDVLLPTGVSPQYVRRHAVYKSMAADVHNKGLSVGGVITQGLKQSDLFQFEQHSGSGIGMMLRSRGLSAHPPSALRITPILHELHVPVRAMILPIVNLPAASRISAAVKNVLLPVLPEGSIWLQDDHMYHATVFHASSHMHPVPALGDQVKREADAICGVASSTCPIEAVLERIALTNSGVLVACWQATQAGAEPAALRDSLKQALPNAPPPEAQMVKEPAILHTTIARLLNPTSSSTNNNVSTNNSVDSNSEGRGLASGFHVADILAAVLALSKALCGLKVHFSQLWFVEEQDLLALALRGRFIKQAVVQLQCP